MEGGVAAGSSGVAGRGSVVPSGQCTAAKTIGCIDPPHSRGRGDLAAEAPLWYHLPQAGAGSNHAGLPQGSASSLGHSSWDELDFAWKFGEEKNPALSFPLPHPR